MIENEIYGYINGFLKWNISKKTSYILGNKKLSKKICILILWNKRKSILARVILRQQLWKKIAKETDKIIIKSNYRWKNPKKLRKWITRREFVHFRNAIDMNKSRIRRIQFVIFNFIKKSFFISTHVNNVVVKLQYWVLIWILGLNWAFRI